MSPLKRLDCWVLVADDDADDLLLLCRTLEDMTRFRIALKAGNGEAVLAYLNGDGEYGDREAHPFPHLLILDLKLPGVDGFEVLRWIQTHPIPPLVVVVITGSQNPKDAARARALGANAVFVKPVGLAHIREMTVQVERIMETAPKGVTC